MICLHYTKTRKNAHCSIGFQTTLACETDGRGCPAYVIMNGENRKQE